MADAQRWLAQVDRLGECWESQRDAEAAWFAAWDTWQSCDTRSREEALGLLADVAGLAAGWHTLAQQARTLVPAAPTDFWKRYLRARARAARRERSGLLLARGEQVARARELGVGLGRAGLVQTILRLYQRLQLRYLIVSVVAGVVIALGVVGWAVRGLIQQTAAPAQPYPCDIVDPDQIATLSGHDITIDDIPLLPGFSGCVYYWTGTRGSADSLSFGWDYNGSEPARCPAVSRFPIPAQFCSAQGQGPTFYFTVGGRHWYCQQTSPDDPGSVYRDEQAIAYAFAADYHPPPARK